MTTDDATKKKKKMKNKKKTIAAENGGQDNIIVQNNSNSQKNDDTKNKKKKGKRAQDNIIADERFSSVHSDPRFQRPHKQQSKVAIDSRFDRMFSDKHFSSSTAPLDKRGKPKKESENPLLHYYHHEEGEEEEEKPKKHKKKRELQREVRESSLDSESSESESPEKELSDSSEDDVGSSSSTSTDDDDDLEGIYDEEDLPSEKEEVPVIDCETHRLAVVNLDWNHVKAIDLYVLLSSFLPKGGQVLSVAVYPSEFGLQRMEYEAVHGPYGLFDNGNEDSEDDDDEIDNEKLRAYEKSRLRYHFAVVECDSSATADHLYKTCDGVEFERTSNVLDLRFIPDSTEFKLPPRDIATEAPSKYECVDFHTSALQQSKIHLSWDDDEPERKKILKRKFNPDQLAELELNDFLASDDGESGESENDEDDTLPDGQSKKYRKVDVYRSLVQSGDGSDDEDTGEKDMEVTFNTGLEDISKRILAKKKDKKSETVWEAYLRKRSEKKKARKKGTKASSEDESSDSDQMEAPDEPDDFFLEEPLETDANVSVRSSSKDKSKKAKAKKNKKERKASPEADKEQEASRAELELLLADDQGTDRGLKGYNLKAKKVKGKKGKEMLAEEKLPTVDYDDPRFSALFNSHLFALDPTDPQYKRSAAYARQQLFQKKHKSVGKELAKEEEMKPSQVVPSLPDDSSGKNHKYSPPDDMPLKKGKHELSSLVRSVKRKVGTLQS